MRFKIHMVAEVEIATTIPMTPAILSMMLKAAADARINNTLGMETNTIPGITVTVVDGDSHVEHLG